MATRVVSTFAFILILATWTNAQESPCPYNAAARSFSGTPVQQAKCLLRHVKIRGALDQPLSSLPQPLEQIIGRPVTITLDRFRNYLSKQGISVADLGGSLEAPLSRSSVQDLNDQYAQYFIIHDASTPNYLDQPFPSDINGQFWQWNDLPAKWAKTRVAHVFVNRTGQSITVVDFGSALPRGRFGTKFARDFLKENGKGLQLHVELIQPRRRDPAGSANNDAIAPTPGFTEAQLDRLALIYIAASLRRGEWLIPAFHAAIDAGIADAHDDPQNFDLEQWAARLNLLLLTLNKES